MLIIKQTRLNVKNCVVLMSLIEQTAHESPPVIPTSTRQKASRASREGMKPPRTGDEKSAHAAPGFGGGAATRWAIDPIMERRLYSHMFSRTGITPRRTHGGFRKMLRGYKRRPISCVDAYTHRTGARRDLEFNIRHLTSQSSRPIFV